MTLAASSATGGAAEPHAVPATFGAVLRREGWSEFQAGVRSGVLALIFLGLTAYLMMVLTHAGYLRQMGASDIPRNAPSLVYLMTSGDAFFLLFAWAWVFAQPIVRDRQARLHEVVLAAPVSLRALLIGRFLGATAVAAVLGASQMVGFLLAPVLEWVGAVPAGSMAATPWAALGWAWLVFTLPSSLGCGALYLIAGLRTRSVAGPFAAAAALMMCWMFSMIVLKDGRIDPFWSTVLDPSGFAESETQVLDWTPHEKSTALLALTPALLVNRLLWCIVPMCWLAWTIYRARREQLVLERPEKASKPKPRGVAPSAPLSIPAPALQAQVRWLRTAGAEAAWQCQQAIARRGVWIAAAGLAAIGVAGGFVHGVGHADGPMVLRPELVAPLMLQMMYLLIAFVAAGATGLVVRRDDTPGFGEMVDATPAPDAVRLAGRVGAIFGLTLLFALVPAVSALAVTAMTAPYSLDPVLAIGYQLLVALPALLELAAAMVLMHALIRPAGPAYAASMLVAFIFIVNHEAEVVTYPPAEIGIPVHLAFSGLTGWLPWGERLLAGDAWKLAIVALMIALAGLAMPRGTDGRWRVAVHHARRRAWGPIGAVALAAVAAMAAIGPWQQRQLVDEGGYRSWDGQLADDAAWEQHWLGRVAPFSLQGGSIEIALEPGARRARGVWHLLNVRSENGQLHMETPHGLQDLTAQVNGQKARVETVHDHAAVDLAACATGGCEVVLEWRIDVRGWDAEGAPPWMLERGLWARASDLAPRLGFDRNRILIAPADRQAHGLVASPPRISSSAAVPVDALAPAGPWRWRVLRDEELLLAGEGDAALDFPVVWAPTAHTTSAATRSLLHDATRQATAQSVADDVEAMAQCVNRRLGRAPAVMTVVQMPRRLGKTAVVGDTLLLPEAPGWDVADQGRGRWLRRADIATALTHRAMVEASDMRESDGSQVLVQGLAGAVGLLCVGDADGLPALAALLDHGADTATQALAASKVPVGDAALAPSTGWYAQYGPLAMLSVAAALDPQRFAALAKEVRTTGNAAAALQTVVTAHSDLALGVPRSADLHVRYTAQGWVVEGEQWLWQGGGWRPLEGAPTALVFTHTPQGLAIVSDAARLPPDAAPGTFLAIPSLAYDRSPKDNAPSSR